MSPEHFTAPKAVDHRSDIYSLGATFYRALTGRMPYPGRSFMEIRLMHARERVVPPHEWVPEIDPAFSTVILRMMDNKAKTHQLKPEESFEQQTKHYRAH